MLKYISKVREKSFMNRLRTELTSLAIHGKSWHVELQIIFNQPEPLKTLSLQAIALKKREFKSDELAAFVILLLTSEKLSREGSYYCRYIVLSSESKLATLFVFHTELAYRYEFQSSYKCPLDNKGVEYLQDTSHAENLGSRILKSWKAKRDFQHYCSYFQKAYLKYDFSFSENKELFKDVITHSSQSANSVLRCVSASQQADLIVELTVHYLRHYPNPEPHDLTDLRSIIFRLGRISDKEALIVKFLMSIRYLKPLQKHIEKSINQQERLSSGKTKSYKKFTLKDIVTSNLGLVENSKELGRLRWRDETDRKYGANNFHYDETEMRECENLIREELGLHKIGEGWASETLLYNITKTMMGEYGIEVIHHHRPKWLSPQEVDVYFEVGDQKFGIEYQGVQHYKPVDFFGGDEGFKKTVERDKKKKELCAENSLDLICFKHTEAITEGNVKAHLEKALLLAVQLNG